MILDRLLVAAAERALEASSPLPETLRGAADALGLRRDDVAFAIEESARGRADLACEALERFGMDPLVRAAAALDPQAAAGASRSLRAVPSLFALGFPLYAGALYLWFVAAVEVGCAALLRYKILSLAIFKGLGTPFGDLVAVLHPYLRWLVEIVPLVIFASAASQGRFGLRRIRRDLELARVYAVAAALAEPGRVPQHVERFLQGREAAFVAHGAAAAADYRELSGAHASSAQARAARAATRLKVIGACVLAAIALVIAASVYGVLPRLAEAVP